MGDRKRIKKMLSWSESSSDEEGDQELKEIKKQVISHRRNLPVVHEPQKLSRKVDPHKITPKFLKEHCRQNNLYMTPRLNTVLYLHHKGFHAIEGLEEYVGLKTLWLESNNIKRIENIQHLEDLRCLFLQHNRLEKIENLEKFQKLTTLNMSHNFLSELTGLAGLPNLHTLIVSHNKFCGVKDLEELIGCKEVAVLDLSNNSIDESEVIQQVLHHMENLKVLTYMGNPIVRKTKDYRRKMIVSCEQLTYLDTRPVTPKDRLCTEAWRDGGIEAERKMRQEIAMEQQKKQEEDIRKLIKIRDENLAKRGIDGNDTEQLIKAEEERGKVLLQQYMEQKKDSKNFIPRQEADDILEPLKGAFQLMETAINMRDGQLQPFTTVTRAKESSHNSSGSGVEVACHGLADIITDYPINSSRMVVQKREEEKQNESFIETGKITEIESGEDELESIKTIEDSKIDRTIENIEAHETIKTNETVEAIGTIEDIETIKDEDEEPFENIQTIKKTIGTTETSKRIETIKTESPIPESFETIQPNNENEPIKRLIETGMTTETIDTTKPTKSVTIVETAKSYKPEITKMLDIRSKPVKTMKTVSGNTDEKPEFTKIIDCRPKFAQTNESSSKTSKTIENVKSTGTIQTTETTENENSNTTTVTSDPNGTIETKETIETIEPTKTTKSTGTTTLSTEIRQTTGNTIMVQTNKTNEHPDKTSSDPELDFETNDTMATNETTQTIRTIKTNETRQATKSTGATTDDATSKKEIVESIERPSSEDSEKSESDFVVIRREEVTRSVEKIKPDLGLIPVKTSDWSSIFDEDDEYYNLIEAAKKAQRRPEIKIDKAVEETKKNDEENQYSEQVLDPNVRKFMEWEDKVLQEMKEDRGWDELPMQNRGPKIQPGSSKGLLQLGSPKKIQSITEATEDPTEYLERQKADLISIEKSMKALKRETKEEESKGSQCTVDVMTEKQYVSRLVSTGTCTDNLVKPPKIQIKKEKVLRPKRGIKMLLDEVEKNAAKFEPEPEEEKRCERKNPLPWESGMVTMMQDLKGSINRDSEHYRALKQGLLTTRRDFIQRSKMLESDSSSSDSESEAPEDPNLPGSQDMTSSDKIRQWFENRSAQKSGELQKPSKAFLMEIYEAAEGQTEDDLEAEIHKKDTEQMLKNSQAFYEKFLKFAETDFLNLELDSESSKTELISESAENAEKEEEKRMEEEMDKTTDMFHDYLKSCENSTQALDDIEKVLDKFKSQQKSESSDEEEIPEEIPKLQMIQPEEPPELQTLFGNHKFIAESPKKVTTASVKILNLIEPDSNLSPSGSTHQFLEESSEEVKKPLIVELD